MSTPVAHVGRTGARRSAADRTSHVASQRSRAVESLEKLERRIRVESRDESDGGAGQPVAKQGTPTAALPVAKRGSHTGELLIAQQGTSPSSV